MYQSLQWPPGVGEGGVAAGGFAQGVSESVCVCLGVRVSTQGIVCLGCLLEGVCPGGDLPNSVSVWGVSAQGGVCPAGVCLGVSAWEVSTSGVSIHACTGSGTPLDRLLEARL